MVWRAIIRGATGESATSAVMETPGYQRRTPGEQQVLAEPASTPGQAVLAADGGAGQVGPLSLLEAESYTMREFQMPDIELRDF